MRIRITQYNKKEDKNKLLTTYNLENSDISETFKILDYMKINEIPLRILFGMIDSDDYEEYWIDEISLQFDSDKEYSTVPCIVVDCK